MKLREEQICRRLALLAPDRPLTDTAEAIEAVDSGNLIPLIYHYNVARHEALKILDETWHDTPVYLAVAAYLDRIGIP